MKNYITPLILFSVFAFATPAAAQCSLTPSGSSTQQSCEQGVAVYRGQQSGPDFRFAALRQQREIAEANARRAEARAQAAQLQRQQAQAPAAPRNNRPVSLGRSSFVFTPFAQQGLGGFGNRNGFNFIGGLNPTGFRDGNFVGSFGRASGVPANIGFRGRSGAIGFSGARSGAGITSARGGR